MDVSTDFLETGGDRESAYLVQKRIKIAYLYHSMDEQIFRTFYKHLAVLRRSKIADEETEPLAGATIVKDIRARFEKARIIILLLSINVEDDPHYSSPEIVTLVRECAEKGIHIWPIIARPYLWRESIFREHDIFFGGPKDKEAITVYNPQEDAHRRIIERIDCEVTFMLAEEWAQEGNICYRHLNLKMAMQAYAKSFECVADYPPALLGMWRTFRKMGELEKAQQVYHQLFSQSGSVQQNRKELSSAECLLVPLRFLCQGRVLLELEKIGEAMAAFQKVREHIPSLPDRCRQNNVYAEVCCCEGDIFLWQGQRASHLEDHYDQAISAYHKAQELNPRSVSYLIQMAKTYIIKGFFSQTNDSFEQALKIYQRLLHQDADTASVSKEKPSNCLYDLNEVVILYATRLKDNGCDIDLSGERGCIFLALKHAREALQAFESALLWEDNNPCYHYGKGQALALLERYPEALESYQRACDCGLYQSASFLIHKGSVLLSLKQYKAAHEAYQQALHQGGDKSECYLNLGRIVCAIRNWGQAVTYYYANAIYFAPQRAMPYLERGRAYVKLGKYMEASRDFEHALALCQNTTSDVDVADIKAAYGDAWKHSSEHTDALDRDYQLEQAYAYYIDAIGRRKHARTYISLGKVCAKLERFTEAISAFEQALSLTSQLPAKGYFVKGQCHYALKQYSEAYAMYKAAVVADPDTLDYLAALANISLELRQYREAMKIFDDIIKNNSDAKDTDALAYAYCGKGMILHDQGMHEKAVQYFLLADMLDPSRCSQSPCKRVLEDINFSLERRICANEQSASIYVCRAHALMLLKENYEALNAYTLAIEFGAKSAYTYYYRGKVYYRLGCSVKASSDYSEALRIDPNFQAAIQALEEMKGKMTSAQQRPLKRFFSWLHLI
jgi:tetratricopeptide (TPR) repeat protein